MELENSVTLISLTKRHLKECIRVVESVFPDEDESIKKEIEASIFKKSFKYYITKIDRHTKSLEYFIAIDNKERVLGVIGIYTLIENFEDTDWIGWYCVSKNHRGKGIGILLLKFAIDRAKNRGKKYLCLYTSTVENEEKAQAIYEKNGFYVTKRIEQEGYDILFRRKVL